GYSGHSARIDSLQRSSQRSARCTYSGHSTRLISAQGSRHIDRRAVLIAVIALDQSSQRLSHFNFITSLIQSPLLPSILLQSSQNHYHVIRLLLLYHVIHTLITHHHFHCRK
ncbi:hypothetical protein L249_1468, partial [Ophiocordyceps polyrhachis-furcata BCC 54312]